jgi:hypothetical protein
LPEPAVAELVGDDHVLLRPQRQHRLITAMAVIGALGRPLVAGDDRRIDIERRRLDRPPALQIEDQLGIGRRQTGQRHRLRSNARLAVLQQRQVLGMKLREEVTRRLRRRKIVAQKQRQRLVLAELVEILCPLAARRPQRQQALHHLRRAQAALALLYLDLAVDDRSRAGQAERLDQPRHPRMSRDQPGLEFRVDFKIKPICHARPRTQRVKLTAPADSTAESIAAEENYRRRSQPILLAGE